MGLLDSIKSVFVGRKDEALSPERLNGMINGSDFNEEQADKISAVYSCIKILSETLSRMPVSVYDYDDENGRRVAGDDYRHDLLHFAPNNHTTNQGFFSTLEVHRNKTGNAFARIRRDAQTYRPVALEVVHPSKVQAVRFANGEMYYLLYNPKRKDNIEPVNSNDLLHFRGVSEDGIWGISPVEVLNPNLSVTYKALKTIDNLYENNAMSTKVLQMQHNVDPRKAEEALRAFKESHGGHEKAGEIIKVPPYMSLENLDMNLQDKEFIDTIKYNSRQIASVFGVPPHLVGEYEASKFNNVEQLQLHFKINTVSSIKEIYKQELEYKLLTLRERKEGKIIDFDLSKLVETDEKTKMETYKNAVKTGRLTPNEVNKMEGWPTYENGDLHYIESAMQAVEYYKDKQEAAIEKAKLENEQTGQNS